MYNIVYEPTIQSRLGANLKIGSMNNKVPYLTEKKMASLRNLLNIQGENGNWNYDSYMCGMYNGMQLMMSVIEARDPEYRTIKDIENKFIISPTNQLLNAISSDCYLWCGNETKGCMVTGLTNMGDGRGNFPYPDSKIILHKVKDVFITSTSLPNWR